MIRFKRTTWHRYEVECTKDEQPALSETFSAGSNSTHGVWPMSGPGEVRGRPELVTYVLRVNAADTESVRRVEGMVKP
jgi:hypothetical protein